MVEARAQEDDAEQGEQEVTGETRGGDDPAGRRDDDCGGVRRGDRGGDHGGLLFVGGKSMSSAVVRARPLGVVAARHPEVVDPDATPGRVVGTY